MSNPDSKNQSNKNHNSSLTKTEQQAIDAKISDISSYISQEFSKAATRGIASGFSQVTEAMKQSPDNTTHKTDDHDFDPLANHELDPLDDHNFAPLGDYDAEEKTDEADEDRLAQAEEREEAGEEPDDSSPDYNRWSQDQQTEDEAIANGVSPDSPDGWAGADLDPDWETGRDQTDDNADNDDEDNCDDKG
ncbi:hypothetical protein [Lacticaseibacillus paracasei]|uniref:hypothetical protein n=1 Tax=Lacticaseibacillus paracasei TaxID=1597 RepID=UPI0018970338|nr:hypothetical protein [Lacticaseibacillus paracasei]